MTFEHLIDPDARGRVVKADGEEIEIQFQITVPENTGTVVITKPFGVAGIGDQPKITLLTDSEPSEE